MDQLMCMGSGDVQTIRDNEDETANTINEHSNEHELTKHHSETLSK